ncbi:hypothetical protein SUNI508_09291 [Seiridium unicorne]|uniref:LSM2-LSM8 complex subunit LSM8 n=1 Tax=Seiridium unicorne TaxID=138068 RepID=A0ABR2UR57_9PEZI
MSNLASYIGTYNLDSDSSVEKVVVLTVDSRMLVGKLESFDQLTNLVLSSALERVIRSTDDAEDSEEVPLGLYIVRGDNVCVVGLVDEKIENEINWSQGLGSALGCKEEAKAEGGEKLDEVHAIARRTQHIA